jgi:hypothetical protein
MLCKPVICTLSEDFLKTLAVKKESPAAISEETQEALKRLEDLGFGNHEVNIAMLEKYKNDVEVTASHLCSGDLSDSIIYKAFK